VVDFHSLRRLGQRHVARIHTILNEYYDILEVDPSYQLGLNALRRIYAKSIGDGMVRSATSPQSAPRPLRWRSTTRGQFPSVTLRFNLAPNSTIGAAVPAVEKATADLHMPPSIATSFQRKAQAFQSSLSSTPILIWRRWSRSTNLIFGVLCESTIHPLTIISTLPSAGLALLTLMLVGMPLDVIGIIGIILLIGIVKKNGIVLVDFALAEERGPGLSSEDAIHRACLMWFRPILITTLAALLGGVPLMLGTGIGSEIRQAARLCDCRWSVHLAAADAFHHTGRLHLHGPTKRLDEATAPALWGGGCRPCGLARQ
jgi:multidrug efflux pump subunit AcrB